MAAPAVTHTVLGELENGTKVVLTDIIPADATANAVVISPLKTIYSYFPGIKDCGTTPRTVSFAQSATILNTITVTPGGDMVGGLIGIISFGV
jgi:hypothetical protein